MHLIPLLSAQLAASLHDEVHYCPPAALRADRVRDRRLGQVAQAAGRPQAGTGDPAESCQAWDKAGPAAGSRFLSCFPSLFKLLAGFASRFPNAGADRAATVHIVHVRLGQGALCCQRVVSRRRSLPALTRRLPSACVQGGPKPEECKYGWNRSDDWSKDEIEWVATQDLRGE